MTKKVKIIADLLYIGTMLKVMLTCPCRNTSKTTQTPRLCTQITMFPSAMSSSPMWHKQSMASSYARWWFATFSQRENKEHPVNCWQHSALRQSYRTHHITSIKWNIMETSKSNRIHSKSQQQAAWLRSDMSRCFHALLCKWHGVVGR